MKYAVALAAAALGLCAPANAADYLFTLTGDYNATWTLDSDPTPDSVFDYKFVLTNVTGDFAGTADNSVTIDFYTQLPLLGGLTITDESGDPTPLADAYDTQLFTGTTADPHFLTGTFVLTNNHGVNPYTLVISEVAGAVPEPATWAMMIAGFGFVGGAMRRRTQVRLAYAA